MRIEIDDLTRPEVLALLAEHLRDMHELSATHGEIKSMRTAASRRRQGAGRAVLAHIIDEARNRGYRRLSLETGSVQAFEPARRLYESFGFKYCRAFAGYDDDPNSVFMTRDLQHCAR